MSEIRCFKCGNIVENAGGYEFISCDDCNGKNKQKACPHDNVTVWVQEMRKQEFSIGKDGTYQRDNNKVKATYWDSASFTCDDCDKTMDKKEFMERY